MSRPNSESPHFTYYELRDTFRKYVKFSEPKYNLSSMNKDFLLYSIYAVECGLKALILKDFALPEDKLLILTTGDLREREGNIAWHHDINRLLKKVMVLKLERGLSEAVRNRNNESIQPVRLHELYRYGGQLELESENTLINELLHLFNKIGDNLGVRVSNSGGSNDE